MVHTGGWLLQYYFSSNQSMYSNEKLCRRFCMGCGLFLRTLVSTLDFRQMSHIVSKCLMQQVQWWIPPLLFKRFWQPALCLLAHGWLDSASRCRIYHLGMCEAVCWCSFKKIWWCILASTMQLLQQNAQHGFPGFLGCTDHWLWKWKNCPNTREKEKGCIAKMCVVCLTFGFGTFSVEIWDPQNIWPFCTNHHLWNRYTIKTCHLWIMKSMESPIHCVVMGFVGVVMGFVGICNLSETFAISMSCLTEASTSSFDYL